MFKEFKQELLNNKLEVAFAIVVAIASSICTIIHWPIF